MSFQLLAGDKLERRDVAAGQDDAGCDARIERFLPTGDAKAPVIAGVKAGEVVLGNGRREVVAAGAAEGEKVGGHLDADGVESDVAGASAAVTVTVEAGQRLEAARAKWLAENVGWTRSHARSYRGDRQCRTSVNPKKKKAGPVHTKIK